MIWSSTHNRWLLLLVRLGLGGLFIVSSVAKFGNVQLFTDAVAAYGLLPEALARLYGSALPWVELFIGCSLILGIFIVPAAAMSIMISASFVVANSYALFHDVTEPCSCLGTLVNMSHPVSLTVDLAMIATATLLIVRHDEPRFLTLDALSYSGSLGLNMRRRLLLKSAFLGLAMVVTVAPVQTDASSLDARIDQALQSDKVVLLFFSTGDLADPGLYQEFQIISDLEYEYNQQICVLRVDYMTDPRSIRQYHIHVSPTLVVIAAESSDRHFTILGRFERQFERSEVENLLVDRASS